MFRIYIHTTRHVMRICFAVSCDFQKINSEKQQGMGFSLQKHFHKHIKHMQVFLEIKKKSSS